MREEKKKKIFLIHVINWSFSGSDARQQAISNEEAFLVVSAVNYQLREKRNAREREHLIKHTRVCETLFSLRLHVLDARLPLLLIVPARPSLTSSFKIVTIIENREEEGSKLKYKYTHDVEEKIERKGKKTNLLLLFFLYFFYDINKVFYDIKCTWNNTKHLLVTAWFIVDWSETFSCPIITLKDGTVIVQSSERKCRSNTHKISLFSPPPLFSIRL